MKRVTMPRESGGQAAAVGACNDRAGTLALQHPDAARSL